MKPAARSTTAAEQLTLFAQCDLVPQGGGTFLAVPRKPLIEVSIPKAVKITGESYNTLYRLYRAGLIAGRKSTPRKILLDVASLNDYREGSRDEEWWTPERKKAFREHR